jgi:hypothetical protein
MMSSAEIDQTVLSLKGVTTKVHVLFKAQLKFVYRPWVFTCKTFQITMLEGPSANDVGFHRI